MPWDVSADVVDFDEAIAFFREKVPMTKAEFDALDEVAQKQAFTVAGVTELDMVADVWDAIDSAISTGTDLETFKAAIGDSIKAAWEADSKGNGAWRAETVFRTNVQGAYAAGRYAQQTDPDALADRPYWMFDLVEDGRECDICGPCDGVTLPADDPWWNEHRPLLHMNCRCDVQSLTDEQVNGKNGVGADEKGPDVEAADGFGGPPILGDWKPESGEYPAQLWDAFEDNKRENEPESEDE